MKTTTILAIVLLASGGVMATGGNQNTEYVAVGALDGSDVAFWCAEGGHDYTPSGEPSDHGDTSDPVERPEEFMDAHDAWAMSGSPECLAGDVVFGTDDDHAFGAVGVCVAGTYRGRDCGNHRFHEFRAQANDIFGLPGVLLVAETCADRWTNCDSLTNDGAVTAFGCYQAELTIPENMARYWRTSLNEPAYFVWIYIRAGYTDETTGNHCWGASGSVYAQY